MVTYKELCKQIAALTALAEAARTSELGAVIESIRATIAEYGLTESDVFPRRLGRLHRIPTKQSAPRYRDPKTGTTWSGRGRPPKWIEGRNREHFLIEA